MKKAIILIIVVVVIIVGSSWWTKSLQKNDGSVLGTNGIHWHPTLSIYMDGDQVEIPANIGLAGGHMPIHTHNETADIRETGGVVEGHKPLHLEFGGIVREEDIRLGRFFEIWNKDFSSECILDKCVSEDGGTIRMMVNGKENAEYENYIMQDGDRIEIFYENISI